MEKLERQRLKMDMLLKYGNDLTKLALEGKLDPVIGRQEQIERVTQILCKRRKNNPCLVGEPGVGKTVIAEGLAQLIAIANVPLKLKGKQVISVDMARLLAGASNRGEFEERLINIINEVKQSEGEIILFIDEVHTLVGAGAGGQALDAANIMKPALARGELKCIGATTLDEYRKHIEKDSALERRFQLVQVPEPSVDEAIQILEGLRERYEVHHCVHFTHEALVAAAHLSDLYISNRFLPDKAIDLIDEAGSRAQLHLDQDSIKAPNVTEMDIQHIISVWTGIPVEKVSAEESQRLLNMEKILHECIIGQDEAVEAICRAIRRARVGIRNPSRPIASFLFTGPTGVGKTELSNVLAAEYYGSKEAIIRLDMSEYMEKHTVSKLFGSPPGYIGHDEGGQLTEAVFRRPHSIVLFDEIEKAHPHVLNVMLQILEDGRLTDSKGRTVNFKNTLLILTSNIGSNVYGKRQLGFDEVKMDVAEELKKGFRPEFLNRLDEIIVFRQLSSEEVKEIMDIMLKKVSERLKGKKLELQVTDRFKDRVAEEGYNPSYGARPMRRAIVKLLEDNLADKILDREVNEGDSVLVDAESNGNVLVSTI